MTSRKAESAARGARHTPWIVDASQAYLEVWNRLQNEGAPPDIAIYQLLYATLQQLTVQLSDRPVVKDEPTAPEAIGDCLHAAAVAAGITALNYWRAVYPNEPLALARVRKIFDEAFRTIEAADRSPA